MTFLDVNVEALSICFSLGFFYVRVVAAVCGACVCVRACDMID